MTDKAKTPAKRDEVADAAKEAGVTKDELLAERAAQALLWPLGA